MFQALNTKLHSISMELEIQNLEITHNHWQSLHNIRQIAEELELILVKADTFISVEKELIQLLLVFNKQNPRIEQLLFFCDMTNKATFVCVCVSDITTFKPLNFLKRDIIIDLTKQNKRLLFTDITTDEWRQLTNAQAGKCLPPTWQANSLLTNKYKKYKELFL
jgi:hypothetical protein